MIPVRKIAIYIFVPVFAVVAAIAGWEHFAPGEEKWVHYASGEDSRTLGEYGSHEECALLMMARDEPSGCRRIDGPFGLLNRIADGVL